MYWVSLVLLNRTFIYCSDFGDKCAVKKPYNHVQIGQLAVAIVVCTWELSEKVFFFFNVRLLAIRLILIEIWIIIQIYSVLLKKRYA